jgi:hypothetical protein
MHTPWADVNRHSADCKLEERPENGPQFFYLLFAAFFAGRLVLFFAAFFAGLFAALRFAAIAIVLDSSVVEFADT